MAPEDFHLSGVSFLPHEFSGVPEVEILPGMKLGRFYEKP